MTDTSPRGAPAPIPLTLLTGFLGAGKTTLLNALLKDPALADTLVIVNEFGEIGLDHLLVEGAAGDDLVLLSAGCLCCTVRGDLVATLEDLLRRRDNGRVSPFRRIVIETTGLADPAPILHALLYHPYLARRFAAEGVVTVVDAVNGLRTLEAHEEALRQAAVADRIVVTKEDLAGPERTEALRRRLADLNPGARQLSAVSGAVPATEVVGGLFGLDGKLADVGAWLGAEAVAEGERRAHAAQHGDDHHHRGGAAHGRHHHHGPAEGHAHVRAHAHDVNRHDERIRAFSLESAEPIGQAAFDLFLDLLRQAHGPRLLRVKGLVRLAEQPDRPVVIHGVQHVIHVPAVLPAWPEGDPRTSRLVIIGDGIEPTVVRRLWDAFLGRPAVDQPDAAALADNPLRV